MGYSGKFIIIAGVILVAWVLGGGLMFHLLEADTDRVPEKFNVTVELHSGESLQSILTDVLNGVLQSDFSIASFRVVDHNNSSATVEFVEQLPPADMWDFSGATYFAITVVTTIGYGNVAPTTAGGMALLVPYALIGIPLTLVLLSAMTDAMRHVLTKLKNKLRREGRAREYKFIQFFIVCVIGGIIFLIVPGAIFTQTEGWSMSIALYYSFVTLSTIGFGDYVAGRKATQEDKTLYRSLLTVWVFFGLAYFSLVIASAQSAFSRETEKLVNSERRNSIEILVVKDEGGSINDETKSGSPSQQDKRTQAATDL